MNKKCSKCGQEQEVVKETCSCGKLIEKGDFQITYGEINDVDVVDNHEIHIAQRATTVNYCKLCSKKVKAALKGLI